MTNLETAARAALESEDHVGWYTVTALRKAFAQQDRRIAALEAALAAPVKDARDD